MALSVIKIGKTKFEIKFMLIKCLAFTEVDECASNPCVHGRCHDEKGGWKCECEDGWEGVDCGNGLYTLTPTDRNFKTF